MHAMLFMHFVFGTFLAEPRAFLFSFLGLGVFVVRCTPESRH